MPDEPAPDPGVPTSEADAGPPGADWAAFYRATIGREPRPLFAKGRAVVAASGMAPGQAVEIGFGDGTETLALLNAGWRVLAIDPAPAAAEVLRSQVPDAALDRLAIATAPGESVELPSFDLLYAGYSLPFVDPSKFGAFWEGVRSRLRPGGFLVVNFFGVRDSWAGRDGMSFLELDAVQRLIDGLDVLAVDEEDQDGDSFLGPKHWHVFHVTARRPTLAAE